MNQKWKVRFAVGAVALAMIPSNTILSYAKAAPDGKTVAQDTKAGKTEGAWDKWVEQWDSIKNDWTQLSINPGKDESEINFAWYSKQNVSQHLKISTSSDMKDANLYEAKKEEATQSESGEQYYSNQVTVTELAANTTYYYQYEVDGSYSQVAEYKTKSADQFKFIFVGDPQIGSSNEKKSSSKDNSTPEKLAEFLQAQDEAVRNDSFNWNDTLNKAFQKTDQNASFILSAGDQIQLTKKKSPKGKGFESEIEYTGFLSPNVLRSLPFAPTVGNHDADNANYSYHFNLPNRSTYGVNTSNDDTTKVGGDYYFTYGSVLFLMLNTQDTNVAEHKRFIEEAVSANKDCKWRVVTLHQDIYGSAEHSNEPEITNLRYQLVPIFEENKIDVVLTGHDHAYSRTKMLLGGHKTYSSYTDDEFDEQLDKDMDAGENPESLYVAPGNIDSKTADEGGLKYLDYLAQIMDEYAVQNSDQTDGSTVVNPNGILYMTASSASGSKYYDLVPRQQSYIANRWQEDVPTYSVIDITNDSFTIDTYRTDTDEKIDTTFTIRKESASAGGNEAPTPDTTTPSQNPTQTTTPQTTPQATTPSSTQTTDKDQQTVSSPAAATPAVTKVTKTNITKAKITKISNKVYTGKAIKPHLTVKIGSKLLKSTKDYTVKYSNNKITGLAKVTIKGKGSYTGTKTITFKIIPKKAVIKSVRSKKKGTAAVMIKKDSSKVSGYQIAYAKNAKFKSAKVKMTTKTTNTLKSLSSKKGYYVRVRAYKKISGKNVFGKYSKVTKVKVK
ncbi:N-acetylmuramoyl-L-alanine amidase [Lachnospiraceae bacterium KM106-2]|nr:N-acetylmuramoyl-L-alanine amidase [Lachnospiraceae bacterium KM106-2]